MKKQIKNVVAVALSCSLSLSYAAPIFAEEISNNNDVIYQIGSNVIETNAKDIYNGLNDLKGDFTKVENGYQINNTGGNNITISSVQGKVFNFSSDITFNSGENKTSLIFGAEKNENPTDIGKFFGLEVWLDGNQVKVKLFQDPVGVGAGLFFDSVTVTEVEDPTQPIHLEMTVDESNNLSIFVNGNPAQFEMKKDFSNYYVGGYFGILTFNSQVTWSNISVSAEPIPVANFNTNLDNLHGINGIWRETEEGLYSSGTGDNFAISDTKVKNFEYSAKITNKNKDGAGSLVFRSEENPKDGSLVMNIDYRSKIFKFFSFPSGGTIKEVSMSSIPENEDGSYDLRVQAYENTIRVFVNDIGIINIENVQRSNEGRLGLLTWEGSVVYQDVMFKQLDHIDEIAKPVLSDLNILTENVSITPAFDENVKVYGMDVQPGVDEVVIAPDSNSTMYIIKLDEYGNIIKEKTKIEDTFTITSDEFVENFLKMDITVETKEGFTDTYTIEAQKWESNEELANDKYRPQFHVTPQNNWMNDPNGMVYDSSDGYWHMYYQLSPSNGGSKPAWGHVRSKDLVNWEQRPMAIQRDDYGYIFSGCAIEDLNNISGFFTDNKPGESKLIAYFTYHDPITGKQSQAMAYSKDHGETWIKEGIILDNDSYTLSGNDFRDPKVFQVEGDTEHYYMVTAGGAAQIFVSSDLKTWERSQNLTYTNGDQIYSECPMMYKAKVNGTGDTKYIYGGSAGFYVVGDMVKDESTGVYKWVAESEKLDVDSNANPWGGFGKYATMTFWNDPVSGREIGVSWLQDFVTLEGKNFMGVQSLPQEYGLEMIDGKYVITCYPVKEVEKLRDTNNMLYESKNSMPVTPEDGNILKGVSGITYDLDATFTLGDATEFGFKLRKGNGQEAVYKYNAKTQKMIVDLTNAGPHQSSGYYEFTLKPTEDNKIQLRMILDQGAVEAFGNYGEANISTVAYLDKNNIGMEFFTDGTVTIDELNIYDMKSMYTGKSGSETAEQQLYLDAPEYVETGHEFTVNANVYPNKGNAGVTWIYDEGLEVINEESISTTVKAKKSGNYTIKAKVGNLEKEIKVRVAVPNFNNNAAGWETISGNWKITDQGVVGSNVGANDSFYMSDAIVSSDKPFTITGDLTINEGQAAGLVFGVTDKHNPNANWFCANIDRAVNGGIAKLFQNNGSELWNVTKPLSELNAEDSDTYHLRIEYDGEGKLSYYVNDILVGENNNTTFDKGYVGIQTFKSNSTFDNVVITTEGRITQIEYPTIVSIIEGSSTDSLKLQLPKTLEAKLDNNTFIDIPVEWDITGVDLNTPGSYIVKTKIEGFGTVQITVRVYENVVEVDKSELQELINKIYKADLSNYTDASVNDLKVKLKEAEGLLDAETATQEQIDAMVKSLQEAFDNLVPKNPLKPVDPDKPSGGNEDITVPKDPVNPINPEKPTNDNIADKEEVQTGITMGTGVYGMIAGASALSVGILGFLKKKRRK